MDHRQHVVDHRQYINALVLKWRCLAYKIANKYAVIFHLEGDADDMRSEAVVATLRAAESFDPARGFKYPTYMGRSVAYRMINFYRQSVKRGFTSAPERPPYLQQRHSRTLRMPVSGDYKDVMVVDLLLAREEPQYGDDLTPDEIVDAMRSYLTPRERQVVEDRFLRGMTLEEIGDRGMEKSYRRTGKDHRFTQTTGPISKEGVRQIQNRALGKLREWFEDKAVPI